MDRYSIHFDYAETCNAGVLMDGLVGPIPQIGALINYKGVSVYKVTNVIHTIGEGSMPEIRVLVQKR